VFGSTRIRRRSKAGLTLALVLATTGTVTATTAAPAHATAVPAVISLSPASGDAMGGTTVTVTGTDLTGASGVTFGGTPGTGLSVTNATTLVVHSPPHVAGAVAVVVTTGGGLSNSDIMFTYTATPVPTVSAVTSASTAGGSTVTITGTDLTGTSSVTFGGSPGSGISVVSPTSVTVVAPAHVAGTAAVVLTTPGGPTDGFLMIMYAVPPAASSTLPTSISTVGGTPVVIAGADLTGVTEVTFGGTPGTGLVIGSASSLTVNAPAHVAGAVAVVATGPGGPTDGTLMITYVAPAGPAVTTHPLAQSPHVGATATFTAAASGFPAPTVQWQVMPSGGSWTDINGEITGTLAFTANMIDTGKQFRAVFHNSAGADAMSSPAPLTVIPDPPDAPAAPVITAGVSSITATWIAPDTNGSAITGYTATASPGPATCSTAVGVTSCVLGATAGQNYTVTVMASSAVGWSAASSPSNTVTATAPVVTVSPPLVSTPLNTDMGPISAAEPGQQITLTGSGYAPYATVVFTIYSVAQQIGSVITDGSGNFSRSVTIPSGLNPETHALVAAGVDPLGATRVQRLDIYVATGATVKVRGPIVRNGGGMPQMFMRGADKNLYTSIQASDGTWSTWTSLGGLIFSEPVAVLNNNGRLQVFVIGGDHSVWSRLQNGDGSFAWWSRVGAVNYVNTLVLTQNDDGTVVVFGRGPDNNLYGIWQTSTSDPSGWSNWANLGGLIFGEPTTFMRDDGRLEVFAIGGDGQLWHRIQASPNSTSWAWWTRLTLSMTNHAST